MGEYLGPVALAAALFVTIDRNHLSLRLSDGAVPGECRRVKSVNIVVTAQWGIQTDPINAKAW